MAWSTDDLARIEQAIADGVLSVTYSNRQVTYRSLDDMLRVRSMIRVELGMIDNGGITFQKLRYSKGL